MKKLLVGLTLLASMSSFANDVSQSSYCQTRGQEAINHQKELILVGVAKGEMDENLQSFFENGVEEMQANHDYLCKGIRISNGPELTAREKQLSLILKGIASGEIDDELADFFLQNLKDM